MALRRIYYGWWILGVMMSGAFLASGGNGLFMGVMLKPMSNELGWSRTATSSAITVSTFVAAGLTPLIGRYADRVSPRAIAPAAGLLVAAGFLMIGLVQHLWHFYLGYILARSFGPGGICTVLPMTTAAHWFQKHRGRAFGLIAMMTPLGGALMAPGAQRTIDDISWRMVFFALAVGICLFYVVPAALIVRREPQDLGIEIEGPGSVQLTDAVPPAANWTLDEALHSPTIWLLMSSFLISSVAVGSLTFHQVAYFTDLGIATQSAVAALSIYAFTGAISSGLWGLLVERYDERLMSTLTLLTSALAVLFLLMVSSVPQMMAFAVVFGLSARGGGALFMLIILHYYGKEFYGSISSLLSASQAVGLGGGPLIASIFFDTTGSYDAIFVIFVGMLLVAAALMWLAKKPEPSGLVRRPLH